MKTYEFHMRDIIPDPDPVKAKAGWSSYTKIAVEAETDEEAIAKVYAEWGEKPYVMTAPNQSPWFAVTMKEPEDG